MNAREQYRRAYQNARCGMTLYISDGNTAIENAYTSHNMKYDWFRGWVSKRVRTWDYRQAALQRIRWEAQLKAARQRRMAS